MNIYNLLERSAEKWPDKVAVFDEYGAITFGKLLQQTHALKQKLQSLPLEEGIALGIITKNSRYFIIALMAGAACGALVMPVYHQQTAKELEEVLREGQLHYLLSDVDVGEIRAVKATKIIDLHGHALQLHQTNRPVTQKTASFIPGAALMRFTSGTTGTAKGVVMSHKTVVERIEAANEVLKLSEADRVVWVLPMAFHFVVSIVLYIKYGVGIIINDSFLAESIIQSTKKHGGTLLYASPMHIKLLASYKKPAETPTLKTVISTTTAISAGLCHTFKKKYLLPVMQAFGIIEVGLPIINTEKSAAFPEAVGCALPAYDVKVLNEEYKPVHDGEVGLLAIRGPGMFDGYLSPPTLLKEVLKKGWFLTGDYAIKNTDGLIVIKGRKKNVINVSGNKVFPYEVEEVVNGYEGVRHSKAYGKSHPLLGEVVAVDVAPENKSIDAELLINYCRKFLSPYKVPQFVNIVDKLEMTASGKIKL